MRSNDYNLTKFYIGNFRVFGDLTSLDVAPLTLLTGTNSSGKSSFIKALHLLTESYKKNGLKRLDIMNNSLQIGDFDSIKTFNNILDEITFRLVVSNEKTRSYSSKYYVQFTFNKDGLTNFLLQDDKGLVLETNGFFEESFYNQKSSFLRLPINILNQIKLRSLFRYLNDDDFQIVFNSIHDYLQTNEEVHHDLDDIFTFNENNIDVLNSTYTVINNGIKGIGKKLFQNYSTDIITGLRIPPPDLGANPTFNDILFPTQIVIKSEIKNLHISDYLDKNCLQENYLFPKDLLSSLFNRFVFIDGVRAKQDMIYTSENSPVFYNTLNQFYNEFIFDNSFLIKWLVDEFKIINLKEGEELSDVFQVLQVADYGGYLIQFKQDGNPVYLSRLGYGVTQLLPIILKVALEHSAIFIIEEPESNLHPALQSKLADFFASALNSPISGKMQFIIETHSEYFIRKLQYLTASPKSELSPSDTTVYYFYHPNDIPPGASQVVKIDIDEQGVLSKDFGSGFFDESDKIAISLWSMNNSQSN